MKDSPFVHIGLRVERSTFLIFNKAVKQAKTTRSKFMRELLNREIHTNQIYDKIIMDSAQQRLTNKQS
ncbi:MAG: hypothetical protein WCJ95_06135 [Mariniphaga sp.]